MVSVEPPQVASRAKRIHITLPERMLGRIDAAAEREGVTRSGWLQRVAAAAPLRGGSVQAPAPSPTGGAKKRSGGAASKEPASARTRAAAP